MDVPLFVVQARWYLLLGRSSRRRENGWKVGRPESDERSATTPCSRRAERFADVRAGACAETTGQTIRHSVKPLAGALVPSVVTWRMAPRCSPQQ